jgi:hypothetical protein
MLGTNDPSRETNASATVLDELLTIMQRIDAVLPDVTILLAPLPPIDPAVANATFGGGFLSNADAIRDANAQLPNLVNQAQTLGINAVLVPVPSLSAADLIDGVHLTDGGYAQLAAAWFACSRPISRRMPGRSAATVPRSPGWSTSTALNSATTYAEMRPQTGSTAVVARIGSRALAATTSSRVAPAGTTLYSTCPPKAST